jgi:hypothetical protein
MTLNILPILEELRKLRKNKEAPQQQIELELPYANEIPFEEDAKDKLTWEEEHVIQL